MLDKYLINIGLEEFVKDITDVSLNNFVSEAFVKSRGNFSKEEIEKLYVFDVPKVGPDGSCSITSEKEDKPYNLAETFGLKWDIEKLKNNPQTLRLWHLKQVILKLQDLIKADWLGVYRKIKKQNGEEVLLKEACDGLFSRVEFPLTKEFASHSNNSTVGLTGKAVVFQDIEEYQGPYYQCDVKVQSEFCVPILNENNEVIGIMDAESFKKGYMTPEILLQIAKVTMDLGKIKLGL